MLYQTAGLKLLWQLTIFHLYNGDKVSWGLEEQEQGQLETHLEVEGSGVRLWPGE